MLFSDNIRKLINDNTEYNINAVEPIEMLSYRRFDIVAKYLYAVAIERGIHSCYAEELYLAHVKAFNNFVEADGSAKVGPEAFTTSMNELQRSIKSNGFSEEAPVPLSRDRVPLDGAHRLGISIALNHDVQTVTLDVDSPIYDYRFFKSRGLKDSYLDNMALEFARLKVDCRMVVIWPTAEGSQRQLEDVLRQYGDIVYFKEIFLSESGAHSFTATAYRRERWIGSQKDGFSGATNKANWCFENKGPLRVFLFESNKDLVKMKDEIREIFGVGKHSIHINDTHEETMELAQTLFNANSVVLLNAMVHRKLSWFSRLFTHYRLWLEKHKFNSEDFCIDGSGTLAAFGIRDVRDLDFLYSGKGSPETGFKEIDCHNNENQHENLSPDEIVNNPDNYFYYEGCKFVSIELIKALKQKRNEVKDQHDVKSIQAILRGQKVKEPFVSKLNKILSSQYIKSKIKLSLLKLRYYYTRLKNRY